MSGVRRLPAVADLTLVTAGAMTANVAGYLLQLLAGRWLGVAGYGEFASLLAVQLLCAVPALALQNVVARELVRGARVATVRALGWWCAAVVAVIAAVLVPVVSAVLHVGAVAAAGALLAAPAQVLLSGEQGILQGGRRFRALATVLGGAGVARVAPALVVLAAGAGAAAALWAAALGLFVAAMGARWAAVPVVSTLDTDPGGIEIGSRDGSSVGADASSADSPHRDRAYAGRGSNLREATTAGPSAAAAMDSRDALRIRAGGLAVLRAVQVQAALMAMSSADLIVARIVLERDDAGRYALGAIATKIAFWLPQAVGVVLYPRMAQPQYSARAIRAALGVLLGVGVAAVAGATVLAPLAPLLAGGDYAPIEGWLWLFALDGALLALLQGALLSAIALDRTAPAAITWIGLAVEVVAIALFAHTLPVLIGTSTLVVGVVAVLMIVVVLRAAARNHDMPVHHSA
ncbi:polysaccharide biosynthesis protein [Nocardia sp. CA2R105]|uniref:polysaccharide biosynthesis protein n=1 Tax=Nocardia coffeae TaxID=2873381 RepID=UPI001CA6B5C9|nr:polysaccharide biosynthesis protein [Nocardia coffeae]MBY8859049.1 polysaccharide biosynthesis protein [Nocardia coffeae]